MAVQNVKIPAKHYVGMVKRQHDDLPLGFITPWGEDAAAQKRIATVDNWAKSGYYGGKPLPSMTIDNVPMNGFRMTSDIRSSSYGGVDKWRIEDPRGFELEITSGNLAQLLSVGVIDCGEILDQCVWARSGQSNVLLSTSTEEYKQAVENTAVAEMKADWKDVKIGNTVLLQNNVRGVWLGRQHMLTHKNYYRQEEYTKNQFAPSDKSFHLIWVDEPIDGYQKYNHSLLVVSSPKLASIVDRSTLTEAEAELKSNELLQDKLCKVETPGYHDVIAFSFGAPKLGTVATLSMEPFEVTNEAALTERVKRVGSGSGGVYTMSDKYVSRFTYQHNYHSNNTNLVLAHYDRSLFDQNQMVGVYHLTSNRSYWNSYSTYVQTTEPYSYSAATEFYRLKVTLKTKAGNTIEAYH